MMRSPASTAAQLALALAVVGLPLARGGVDWQAQSAAVVLAALAFALLAGSRHGDTPLFLGGLAVALVVTVAQLVPVPTMVHRLSPGARDLFESALRPIGLYPAARPLSLDPPATARELAKGVACLLAAGAAARVAGVRSRQERLLGAVALSGIVVAGSGLSAALAGLGPFLEPRLTFVNPNHLAGFLNLTSFVALGFALSSRGRGRLLWLFGFAISGSGVLLSLSRGGIAAFFVGAAVLAALYVRRLRLDAGGDRRWRFAVVPGAVSVALAVAAYLALDAVLSEMRTVKGATSELKLTLWPVALSMLRRFPFTGIGRGAFETASAAWKVEPVAFTFTHVENEWLQVPLDLGIPAGLVLLGAIAWSWLRAARAADLSRPEMGALAGAAALAAHNVVDFSLEILGVAIPFAVVIGLLSKSQPSLRLRAGTLRGAAAAMVALAATGMALHLWHGTEKDAASVARAGSATEAAELARRAAAWHPADYFPQAIAGARLVQDGRCAEGLRWLGRAMGLNPTASEPHRFAARCLAAASKDDLAKREYRLAMLFGDSLALAEAKGHYPALQDLLEVAPETPQGLLALAALLATDRPFDVERVLRRAWEQFGDLGALRGLASTTLVTGTPDDALELARLYQKRRPADPAGYLVAATALARLDRAEEAHGELELGLSRNPGSPQLVVALAEQALALRRFAEARRLAESMAARTGPEFAGKRLFIARALWAQGRSAEAVQEARAARDAAPADVGVRLALASYCAGVGRYDEAIAEVEAAAALPASPPGAYAARLEELRAARQAQIERRNREQILGGPLPSRP